MVIPAKLLFPISEVVALTGVPRTTINKQIRDGAIPEKHVTTIGHQYITRAGLCALLRVEDPDPLRFQSFEEVAS